MPESRSGKDIQAIVGQATNVATQCLSLPQTTKPASGWKAHVQLTLAAMFDPTQKHEVR